MGTPHVGDAQEDRETRLYNLAEEICQHRVDGACLSTVPGAVVAARNYLVLEENTWRIACGCSACLDALCDSVESRSIVVRQMPASEVPTLELPNPWESVPFSFTGPEKDPSVGN